MYLRVLKILFSFIHTQKTQTIILGQFILDLLVTHYSINIIATSRKLININATYFTHADCTLGAYHLACGL